MARECGSIEGEANSLISLIHDPWHQWRFFGIRFGLATALDALRGYPSPLAEWTVLAIAGTQPFAISCSMSVVDQAVEDAVSDSSIANLLFAGLALAPRQLLQRIRCRRAIRSSVLGWVENSLKSAPPLNGFMM